MATILKIKLIFPCLTRSIAMCHPSRIAKPVNYPRRINFFENNKVEPIKSLQQSEKVSIKNDTVTNPKSINENLYKILGIKDNASIEEIKRAYYILAKKYHPDRVGYNKSSDVFAKILEAYNILSDGNKKQQYDQARQIRSDESVKILPSTTFRFKEQTKKLKQLLDKEYNPVKNVCTEMAAKYRHSIINVSVTFLESVQGTTKTVFVKSFSNCPKCNQSTDRTSLGLCTKCNGLGSFVLQTKTYKTHKECDLCYGRCYVALCKCLHCDNRGFLIKENKVNINIKPGVQNNDIIKITHPDDPKLTLQAKVKVLENDHFKRRENDIYTEKKISISDAVLGGSFKVRGIYGDIILELKPGTESNSIIKLPGKGVKSYNANAGDHYVTLRIDIPKVLSKEQKYLFMELAKTDKQHLYNKL